MPEYTSKALKDERYSRLHMLIRRAEVEHELWYQAPAKRGGLLAKHVRSQALSAWHQELAKFGKDYHVTSTDER